MGQASRTLRNLTSCLEQFNSNNGTITGASVERNDLVELEADLDVTHSELPDQTKSITEAGQIGQEIADVAEDELHEIAEKVFVNERCSYDHYDDLKKLDYDGYANDYLDQKWDDSTLENEAKLNCYKILYQIDQRLGTTPELQLFYCCQNAVSMDIIKFFENIKINYEFKSEKGGTTIFLALFNKCLQYLKANNKKRASLKTEKYKKLLLHVEEIFKKLTEFADFENNQEKMKRILETTDKAGTALISKATIYWSKEIVNYLLTNKINFNNCNSRFMTAEFYDAEITKRIIPFVNPKIISHDGKSNLYDRDPQNFKGNVKTEAEKYPNAIHVAVMNQECESGCPTDCKSKLVAFYYKNGVYIQRIQANQVGQGAFGSVFGGKWHGRDAVFKFIRMSMTNLGGMTYTSDSAADLESRLAEIKKIPKNSNILKPLGHFRQQELTEDESTGKYFAENFEVFIFKRCRMDLEKFRNDEYPKLQDPKCKLLLFIMKQCLESLKALSVAKLSHNDLKPENFLVDWPQGSTPTVSNLKVFLTDFGMVDKAGGTPVYCSPEGLTGTTPGVSDMFLLGRVFTFLVLEDRSLFYTMVFFTILNRADLQSIRSILSSFSVLNLIREMTHIDKTKRIKIQQVKQCLANMNIEIITKAEILTELAAQGHHVLLNSFANADIDDFQVTTMLNESKYSFEKIDPATNTIDQDSARFRLNTQISKNIHEQDESSLCWAFSSSSMLRRSMKDFYKKHKDDSDLNLTSTEKAELETWLEDNKLHSILRSQITMNPIPKRIKKGATAAVRGPHEAHYIKECSERMAFSTALDGPGIFNLERIQLFFAKMKLPLSKVIIKQDYFELYNPSLSDNQRFADFVRQSKLCPVIGAVNFQSSHAMVVDKAMPHGTGWYFQCKNSYKSNPQVFVGHQNLASIEFKPFDAVIISFDRIP